MTPIEAEAKQLLENNYRQVVEMQIGDITITESDVIQGSFTLNRTVCSMDSLELGSAIASELSFDLRNYDKQFSDTPFESEEMTVKIGVKKWDAQHWENAQLYWIPLGKFIVSKSPRKKEVIHITALDRMIKFDQVVDVSSFQFPITVESLVEKCCQWCGVPLKAIGNRPNKTYSITKFPTFDGMTHRNLIQWCACLMGACAMINAGGELEFKWYEGESVYTSTPSNRYDSDCYENDISLTGLIYSTSDESGGTIEYIVGTRGNALDISGCLLISGDITSVLTNIWNAIKVTHYRPYTATSKPVPYLWPMDKLTFTDLDGVEHSTILTTVDYKMNANGHMEATGITETENSYFRDSSMTVSQIKALEAIRKYSQAKASSVEQATLEMNEVIAGSLGLHKTEVQESNGSTTTYWHDGTTLAQSTIVYTFKSGGFAWTKSWNNGNPTWQFGFTKDGNAILNAVYAHKITGEALEIHSISKSNLDTAYVQEVEKYVDDKASTAEKNAKDDTTKKLQEYTKTADFSVALDQIQSKITDARTYASQQASTAEKNAKDDTTKKLQNYPLSTTVYSKNEVNQLLSDQENSITLTVSKQVTTNVTNSVKNMISSRKLYTCLTDTINTPAKNLFTEGSKTPTVTNRYLWGFERIQTDASTWTDDTVRLICVYGEKGGTGPAGSPGKDGTSFAGLTSQYAVSTSNTSAPTNGWLSAMPAYPTDGQTHYLWERQQVTKSDGTTQTTTPTLNSFWKQMSSEWASLKVESDNIKLEVGKKVNTDSVIAAINLSPETAVIKAGKIALEGLTTINGGFKVLTDGSIEAVNGHFSGTIGSNGLRVWDTQKKKYVSIQDAYIYGNDPTNSVIKTMRIDPTYLRFGTMESVTRYAQINNYSIEVRDDQYNFLGSVGVGKVHMSPNGLVMTSGNNKLEFSNGALFGGTNLYNMITANVAGKAYYGLMSETPIDLGFEWSIIGTSYLVVKYQGNTYKVAVSSSDARLKANIEASTASALQTIRKIKHYTFAWKDGGYQQEVGFIAQQLETEVRDDFVLAPKVKGEMYGINDPRILPYATKAIQELDQEVAELKAKNTELEERLARLESIVERSMNGTTNI